jgi:hypothetical protein
VATPAISVTSAPSTSTGWWVPTATGSPSSTATIMTVRPVAIRSRSTAVRGEPRATPTPAPPASERGPGWAKAIDASRS